MNNLIHVEERKLNVNRPEIPYTRTTQQPFSYGTLGSFGFRIPAMITLQNGDIMVAADARYNTWHDGGGLDTAVAISSDNGKTWDSSFLMYLDDSASDFGKDASTCIDPILVQGKDGTIYCLIGIFPTEVSCWAFEGFREPILCNGCVDINGKERIAVTSNYSYVFENPRETDASHYEYYLGDADKDGYFPVLNRKDGTPSEYILDGDFHICKVINDEKVYLYQKQVDTDAEIRQSIFYRDSELHVSAANFWVLSESKDNGKNWTRKMLNPTCKNPIDTNSCVAPGRGLVTKDGTVLIGFYENLFDGDNLISHRAAFLYKKNGSAEWERAPYLEITSSEHSFVELDDGTIRMFFRNSKCEGKLFYCDVKLIDGEYKWGERVETEAPTDDNCNLCALKYSKKTKDGKQIIFVSAPSESFRSKGKIYTFVVNDDNTLTLVDSYQVNKDTFQYSCLTELKDGTVSIIYEIQLQDVALIYKNYDIKTIAPSIELE